jgi:hypothetical protein
MAAKGLDPETQAYYRHAMRVMNEAGVEFLVGGAYAFARYTGIVRHTKDFDVFLREGDLDKALAALSRAGFRTERTFPHWLAKAWRADDFVDLIYSSGNGIAVVDELWFQHATAGEVLGVPCRLIPAEEMIWSKAFIMERERFDGADIAHVINSRADQMDWRRLVGRFGPFWRVLLVHLTMFGFIYPGRRDKVPSRVLQALLRRLQTETETPVTADPNLCQGTLISRQQFLPDLQNGCHDARLQEVVRMTQEDIAHWTSAIYKEEASA